MPWPKAAGSGAQLVKELRNRQVRSYWALGYGFGEFFFLSYFLKIVMKYMFFFVFWVSCLDVLVFKYLWVCFERFVWKFHIGKLEKMRPFLTNIVEMGLQSLPRKRGKYQWSKNDYKTNTYGSFLNAPKTPAGPHSYEEHFFFKTLKHQHCISQVSFSTIVRRKLGEWGLMHHAPLKKNGWSRRQQENGEEILQQINLMRIMWMIRGMRIISMMRMVRITTMIRMMRSMGNM